MSLSHLVIDFVLSGEITSNSLGVIGLAAGLQLRQEEFSVIRDEDSRIEFDVRFYLVAILFIIFDLEIAFLFPWAITLGNLGLLGFLSMMIFLFILTVGFIYEWKKGALDWE